MASIVMSSAARYLTPVTLELGEKCPAIFDYLSNPSDFKMAVKRIVGAKWGVCTGQACIAIDYLLVKEKHSSELLELLKRKFYGDNMMKSTTLSRIINKHHFERL